MPLEQPLGRDRAPAIARQEHEARAVLRRPAAERCRAARHLAQEPIRHLDQDAGAVAGVGLAAAGAAVQQVDQDLQRLRATIACERRPLMSTTKPTPQASCSYAGS